MKLDTDSTTTPDPFEARLRDGLRTIAESTPQPAQRTFDPAALTLVPVVDIEHRRRAPYFAAAAAVGVVGIGLAVLADRGASDTGVRPGQSAGTSPVVDTVVTPTATNVTDSAQPGTSVAMPVAGEGGEVVDTTVPATLTPPGSGPITECAAADPPVTRPTLYLGGPASDQNMAAAGFIYSQPDITPPQRLVGWLLERAVLGTGCGGSIESTDSDSVYAATISLPAVPVPLKFDVDIARRDGLIGVTAIRGDVSLVAKRTHPLDATSIVLSGAIPATAVTADVRFKKGDDVWGLRVDAPFSDDIPLVVPSIETDRFPDVPIDWVLVTLLDADGGVVGVAGMVIPPTAP